MAIDISEYDEVLKDIQRKQEMIARGIDCLVTMQKEAVNTIHESMNSATRIGAIARFIAKWLVLVPVCLTVLVLFVAGVEFHQSLYFIGAIFALVFAIYIIQDYVKVTHNEQ